jgi:hypothetical protein
MAIDDDAEERRRRGELISLAAQSSALTPEQQAFMADAATRVSAGETLNAEDLARVGKYAGRAAIG